MTRGQRTTAGPKRASAPLWRLAQPRNAIYAPFGRAREAPRRSARRPALYCPAVAQDIGESLVGSYLRYIVGCEVVVYNTHTPEVQGEIDVIGLKTGEPRTVWLCEAITHIRGTLYSGGYAGTVQKIREKVQRARDFANVTFPGETHRYEIWSPVVPSGVVTLFSDLEQEYNTTELDLQFVVNERYAERAQELIDHAKRSTKATSEPAYRLLQILAKVRGELRI